MRIFFKFVKCECSNDVLRSCRCVNNVQRGVVSSVVSKQRLRRLTRHLPGLPGQWRHP